MEEQVSVPSEITSPWAVLASFAFHAFCNQFMWMNFAASTLVAEQTFRVDDADINWCYSAALLATVPSLLFVMAFSRSHHRVTSLVGVVATVAAAWIRYSATLRRSYPLALISSVALAPGTGAIFTDFAALPVRLFPQGVSRQVATGIAVQVTFLGWAVGGLLASMFVRTKADLPQLCFIQALVASVTLPVFLIWFKLPPQPSPERTRRNSQGRCSRTYGSVAGMLEEYCCSKERESSELSCIESIQCLLGNWRFLVQAVACGLLQAVGFTIPAVLDEVLLSKGYLPMERTRSGFAFIMSGALFGLILSGLAPGSDSALKLAIPRLVLKLFWMAVFAMLMLQLSVMDVFSRYYEYLGGPSEEIINFALLVTGGSCTLGFVNVCLPIVCAEAHPVAETYSGGFTELLSQLLAGALTQLSTDRQFAVVLVSSVAAAILMTTGIWASMPVPDAASSLKAKIADPEESKESSKAYLEAQ